MTVLTPVCLSLASFGPAQAVPAPFVVDGIITAAATVVAMVALTRWIRRGRDPLAGAPPRPHTLREDSILLVICIYLLAAAVFGGLSRWLFGGSDDLRARMLTGNAAQIAGVVACLMIVRQSFDGGVDRFFRGTRPPGRRHTVSLVIVVTVVAIGLCPWVAEATVRALHYFAPAEPITPHPTIEALRTGPLSMSMVVGLWVSAAIIAPVAEEVFFRGVLQSFLGRILPSRWAAILLTSIAFGIVHVSQIHTVIALTVLAVLIGYAYERSGSIVVPIVIHSSFNLKTLIWEAWGGVPVS